MLRTLILLAAVLAGSFIWLTRPLSLDLRDVVIAEPDPVNGELIFHAGSCAACHEADLRGGYELSSPFGLFRVPNISPDPISGIGAWTQQDFLNAMLRGISPSGQHYYPAFPYTSYAHMTVQDVIDLKAYIDQLPPARNEVRAHELGFPWNIRRGIGLWKRRYFDSSPHLVLPADADPELVRGRYLAEGPGHCTECHTPRDDFGGPRVERWLAGAANLEGDGRVPNITPSADGLGEWSLADIKYFLETGMTPDFDTAGGAMVKVQENLARLEDADRAAIATYLKALPALPKVGH